MNVKFYNMTSPTIKISKTKTLVGEAPATPNPTGPVNIVDPVLIIDKDRVPANANYMEIPTYGRSYFIVSIDWTTANTAVVTGHSDVLSNFAPSGTLNFVRGAGTLTEMDDASYPISDYMVEEYFPMTTWTDIFSAGGSGRQYLLRTICSDQAETPTYVTINQDQYFWAYPYKDIVHNEDGTDTTYYYCFKTSNPRKDYVPELFFVEDITHYTQIQNLDYVQVGSDVYQFVWPGPGWGSGANNALMGYKGQLNA